MQHWIKKVNIVLSVLLALGLLFSAAPGGAVAETAVYIDNLAPSWDAPGGGGVFSAYIGPDAYDYVSPGETTLYDGREAGIIKAGLTVDPISGIYQDEGLFAFIPSVTIETLAAGPLNFDVVNQEGTNPVWMTIEIDEGIVGDRTDNVTYQYVPTSNPIDWHTVDGTTGLWQKWNNSDGDVTGNPLLTLDEVAAAHPTRNVVRVYLRLGMGDSYHGTGNGTIAWVDKVTIGTIIYDFVLARYWYVSPDGLDTNEGTLISPFQTIQKAIEAASAQDTIHVAAGTYTTTGQVVIDKNLTMVGADKNTTIIKPDSNTGSADNDTRGWFLVNPGVEFNLSNVTLDGAGKLIHTAIRSWGNGIIENNIIKNIRYSDYLGIGIYFFDTVTVRNNTLSNIERIGIYANGTYEPTDSLIEGNTYTGKGDGEWLDYGIEVERGAHVTIRNNTITNCKGVAYDGSTSAGIYATTYFANPSSTTMAYIENNLLSDNLYGISAGYLQSDPLYDDTAIVVARSNQFLGNTYGISAAGVPVDAENNWWGAITGPPADHFVGPVVPEYWCGDAACSFFLPQILADNTVTTPWQTPVDITLTSSDVGGNTMLWAIVDGPAHGTVTVNGNVVTYTPDAGYSGSDSFTFKATLEGVDSNVGTVTITVSEPFIYYFPIIFNN